MKLPTGSLHRRVRRILGGLTLVGLVGIAVLLFLSTAAHSRSLETTRRFVEDERTSDRITRSVLRQLAVAVAFPTSASDVDRDAFLRNGIVVHDELRRYLFGELTPEERLRLAELRESHQRFEVEAIQAAELFARGQESEARTALAAMTVLADEFVAGLEGFFSIRIDALEELRIDQERLIRHLYLGTFLLAVGMVVLTVLAAWELSRRVARPLASLSEVTERIAAGELDTRLPAGGDDEFRGLARRFNRMAETLQRREAELTRAITDVAEAQEELIAAEKLSALGRMSAGFAHELNNPLTAVLGYAELLERRLDGDPPPSAAEVEELLGPVLMEASRARSLVRNLLHFARRPEGAVEPVRLRETLDVVVGLRRYSLEQDGVGIDEGDIPDVQVMADPQLLHGVFLNLLNNAHDALREVGGGRISIGAERKAEGVVTLRFTDTGPGLTEPDRVFEPFYTTKPVGEGTGIGLSLVHQFVTSFGGAVRASNADVGGARFEIDLPVARSAPEAAGLDPAREPTDPSAAPPDARGRVATILIVEDEPHLLRLQHQLLAAEGHRVLEASSVEEALRWIETEPIETVVSDVRMPGGTGVDLFQRIRESYPALSDRLIFVTGDPADRQLREVLEEYPVPVLRKPFTIDEYLRHVREVLSRSE